MNLQLLLLTVYAMGVEDGLRDCVEAYNDGHCYGYRAGYSDARDIFESTAPQPYYEDDFDGFYDADEVEGPFEVDIPDEAYSVDTLPPMQEQWIRDPVTGNWIERPKSNPFAWS